MKFCHDSLPENDKNEITILSAKYGADEKWVDVTAKVKDLFDKKEIIKSGNRLGGDPIFGTKKSLVIEYNINGDTQTKTFKEGSQVNL